ncbi:MAG: DNA repair protein RecN [Gammaproteobacteria bacterium]|nr:MAG: DNA repair protein RecN [Gammaproteobacteria bacterium]
MLLSIDIRNFAIIQSLQLDWHSGMSVITGETGAGKSIVIDALGLTLGEKADQNVITSGAKQTEISALYEVDQQSEAFQWLKDNDLLDDEILDSILNVSPKPGAKPEPRTECILRRVIVKEGRSKCYINGRNTTQSQLKQLGSLLVDIHGQHAHQSLLKNKEQLNLLDRYADHSKLLDNVKIAYQQLKTIEQRAKKLQQEKRERDAKRELLSYQVEELNTANPEQSVLDNLEMEHKQAATSNDRLALTQNALSDIMGDGSTSSLSYLNSAIGHLKTLATLDKNIAGLLETLTDAESLIQEAHFELSDYRDQLECDPEQLQMLDKQLEKFHDLARKHHVSLQELPNYFAKLQNELKRLHADDDELEQVEKEQKNCLNEYLNQAKLLTISRKRVAKKLSQLVTDKIQPLAMEGGNFSIQLNSRENNQSALGMEEVEFLVSANPGQPLQALTKVASGGELSRISLAIAVITSEQQLVPCIIFDEVDVGIGGATAETVGILLRQLAKDRQVLCVTHQPQVASCGHHHLIASKTKLKQSTTTQVFQLNKEQRVDEIARMLGGKVISSKTLSHAKEMLNIVS